MCGAAIEEVRGEYHKLRIEELCYLHNSLNIDNLIKRGMMKQASTYGPQSWSITTIQWCS
jgi:hypothetical protein